MPKVPYPYEVNVKLVTGNGSLISICSLSNRSLSPSLTGIPCPGNEFYALKTCQIVADTCMIHQFHEFLKFIFGGFLEFGLRLRQR